MAFSTTCRFAELSATRMSETDLRSLDSAAVIRSFSSSRCRMYSTVGCEESSRRVASATAARSASTRSPCARNASSSNASAAPPGATVDSPVERNVLIAPPGLAPLATPSFTTPPAPTDAPVRNSVEVSSRKRLASSALDASCGTSRVPGLSPAGIVSVRNPPASTKG